MSDERSTARRLATGTAANVAGQAVSIVAVIVVSPIVLHAVGGTDYGVWVLFGAIASFALLLELGIAAALVKYVAEHAARDQVGEAAAMVGSANALYALSAALIALIGILAAVLVPAVAELHGAFARLFSPLAVLVGLNVAVSMLAITPVAVLRGLQRFTVANAIIGGGALFAALLTLFAVALDTGIVGVAAATLVASGTVYVASFVLTKHSAPAFMAVPVLFDRARAARLLRFSRSVAVIQVAIRLQARLDAVVIAAALPIRFVSPYSFAMTLANGIGSVTDQFGKVLLPVAAQVGASSERSALRSLFVSSTRLTMAITFAVGMPVAILGGRILGIWVGHGFSVYGSVATLLAIAAIVDLASYPAAAVLQGIERHGPIAWMSLASGVANVALSIALVGPWGIRGVAAATLIASAAEVILLVLPYAARELGVTPRQFCLEVLVRLVPAVAVLTGVLIGGDALLAVTSVPRLVLVVGVALIAYSLVYATFGASRTERDAYRSAASALLHLPANLRARRSPTPSSLP
jgi:O-antigen/teichoic acid export membrane protein